MYCIIIQIFQSKVIVLVLTWKNVWIYFYLIFLYWLVRLKSWRSLILVIQHVISTPMYFRLTYSYCKYTCFNFLSIFLSAFLSIFLSAFLSVYRFFSTFCPPQSVRVKLSAVLEFASKKISCKFAEFARIWKHISVLPCFATYGKWQYRI